MSDTMPQTSNAKPVETLTHVGATRRLIPSAEHQPLVSESEQHAVRGALGAAHCDAYVPATTCLSPSIPGALGAISRPISPL